VAAIRVRVAAVPMPSNYRARCAVEGFTALELLLATATVITLMAMAVPLTGHALDHIRTGMAARYLEARIMDARMQAIRQFRCVGFRFVPDGADYQLAEYLDANRNGIRTVDIGAGIDTQVASPEFMRDHFNGVSFGLQAGIPDVDGTRSASPGDGVRIGTSRILTLGPDGTATSGTLYVHGRKAQFAIRILGATGRTRVLRFDPGLQQWVMR
jgi:hypothetical protein